MTTALQNLINTLGTNRRITDSDLRTALFAITTYVDNELAEIRAEMAGGGGGGGGGDDGSEEEVGGNS